MKTELEKYVSKRGAGMNMELSTRLYKAAFGQPIPEDEHWADAAMVAIEKIGASRASRIAQRHAIGS